MKKPIIKRTHATMIMAAKRWTIPAVWAPPRRRISHCAQPASLYRSGMPVKTSTVKLTMMKKWIQRWNNEKRRYCRGRGGADASERSARAARALPRVNACVCH